MGHWIIAAALAVYGGLLGVLLRRAGRPGGYLAEKTLCSAAFVALAALCARLGSRPEAFWKLLPALLCCVAGDVVLALFNRRRRPALFLAGLVSFLAGHGLFVWGLCRLQPLGWPVPAVALAGLAALLAVDRAGRVRLGRMRPWAMVYALFVSALLGKGLQLAAGLGDAWCFLVLAGAALFWLSDLLILFLYFTPGEHRALHAANLLTYYGAMALLALSLAF